VNIWVIKILKEKKINFEQIFEFFQNYEFWFFNIYLSLILKWSNIGKKNQIPKIPSNPSSYQNVSLIFYFQFWELFIII